MPGGKAVKTGTFFQRGWDFLKRRKGIIPALAILCVAVYSAGVWIAEKYTYYVSGMWEWEVKDFSGNKPYFALLAENLYGYFEEEQENNSELASMRIVSLGDKWQFYNSYNGAGETTERVVDMTEEERASLDKVTAALHHKYAGFDQIVIYPDRVTFVTVYDYGVIWSRNGEKPTFYFSPEEKGDFYVTRLSFFSNKWYQCRLH